MTENLFKNGKLNRINRHKISSVEECLIEDYKVTKANARWLAGFLVPMMRPDPFKRNSAMASLESKWLASSASPRGSLFMNDSEWHDSLWNLNVVEEADLRKTTAAIDSDREDADIGEFNSEDSEVSFSKTCLTEDSTKSEVSEILQSDRSFLEKLVLEGQKVDRLMNLDLLDDPSLYSDLK